MTPTAQLISTRTQPMTQGAQLFIGSIKMLIHDKTAFLMALISPIVFVLVFSLFDVSFSAEGELPASTTSNTCSPAYSPWGS